MSNFSKRLREQLDDKGLSQNKLAKLIGVHHSIIGRYERYEAKPTTDIVILIANDLDTTVGYLLGENEEVVLFKDSSMFQRFNDFVKLPEEKKLTLLRNVNGFLRDLNTRKAYSI